MRRLKFLGLVLVAVFASAAALSTSAYAVSLPENLPLTSTGGKITGNSEGEPSLNGATEIKCKEAPSEGTEEAGKEGVAPAGTYHITFKGCSTLSGLVKCNSLGDASGVILALGTWKLVFDVISPELLTATVFTQEVIHIECSTTLVEVKGSVLCLDLKPTESNVTHSFHCIAEKAKATEKHYFSKDPGGTEVAVQLLCALNHGAFEECAELALGSVKTEKALSADI